VTWKRNEISNLIFHACHMVAVEPNVTGAENFSIDANEALALG
jgi:hypothetical protein